MRLLEGHETVETGRLGKPLRFPLCQPGRNPRAASRRTHTESLS